MDSPAIERSLPPLPGLSELIDPPLPTVPTPGPATPSDLGATTTVSLPDFSRALEQNANEPLTASTSLQNVASLNSTDARVLPSHRRTSSILDDLREPELYVAGLTSPTLFGAIPQVGSFLNDVQIHN